jgi:hypothetical protein
MRMGREAGLGPNPEVEYAPAMKQATDPGGSALRPAIGAMEAGDYMKARRIAQDVARRDDVPEGEKRMAGEIARSTQIDRVTLLVGASCFVLPIAVFVLIKWVRP